MEEAALHYIKTHLKHSLFRHAVRATMAHDIKCRTPNERIEPGLTDYIEFWERSSAPITLRRGDAEAICIRGLLQFTIRQSIALDAERTARVANYIATEFSNRNWLLQPNGLVAVHRMGISNLIYKEKPITVVDGSFELTILKTPPRYLH